MEVRGIAKTASPFEVHHNEDERDLYLKMQELERELEFLEVQEEMLKIEQRTLTSEAIRFREEVSFWLNQSAAD
jgi:26S proteasome regulatory subunit T3